MTAPARKIRLGVLVPSSNTALEPLTTSILSSLPHISVHYSRFSVTEIALSPTALSQFDDSKILSAALLLADAKVDVIGWSGTSAGWLGFNADIRLCGKIQKVTGIEATSSALGLCNVLEILMPERLGRDFGLVTPYLDEVQERIAEVFGARGFAVIAESHLNRTANVEFADIGEEMLDRQVGEVVKKMEMKGDFKVISTFCTNLRAAQRVEFWEGEHSGLVVLDTMATVVWDMLRIAKVDTSEIMGWGKIFQITAT